MPHKDKEARNAYLRAYKAKRRLDAAYREAEREKDRQLYEANKERTRDARLAKNARYREAHRAELAERERLRNETARLKSPEEYAKKMRERAKRFREENKGNPAYREAARRRARESYARKKDDPSFKAANVSRVKDWQIANRERVNDGARKRLAIRYVSDVQFKIALCLRRRLYMAVKGMHRSGLAVRELGCSIPEFKAYIEAMFVSGMNWDNWSKDGWHLDHIKPLHKFDLTDPEQLRIACHFTNLQPLWSLDNHRKGSKYVE